MKSLLSIQNKFFIMIFFMLLIVFVPLLLLMFSWIEERMVQTMHDDAKLVANIVRINAASSLIKDDLAHNDLFESMHEIGQMNHVKQVMLLDHQGTPFLKTMDTAVQVTQLLPDSSKVERVLQSGGIVTDDDPDHVHITIYHEVLFHGKIMGVAVVQLSYADHASMQHEVAYNESHAASVKNQAVVLAKLLASHGVRYLREIENNIQVLSDLALIAPRYDSHVRWVEVFGKQCDVIAHTDSARVGFKPLPTHEGYVQRVINQGETIDEVDLEHGRYNLFVPAIWHEKVLGAVEVVMDSSAVSDEVRNWQKWFFMALVIFSLVLFGGLYVMFQRVIIQPIARLQKFTDEVADGALSGHVEISQHDELGALATSFNSMVLRLQASQDALIASENYEAKRITEAMSEGLIVFDKFGH
ncbi:MAG: HAMP domain-containing protein, partial [Zetaproteobacteria bacterium]|nr:HAMP domain-containing protein [Zetaproteobacteria bacterium]